MKTEDAKRKLSNGKDIVIISGAVLLLGLVYIFGPKVARPKLDTAFISTGLSPKQLSDSINRAEAAVTNIRPDNESRILFARADSAKTPYSLLYLHGFTASYREGYPINEEFARRYKMNAYFPRLQAHGLNEAEPMLGLDADSLWLSAKQALAVAEGLGDKVIIMSCSTGGTLALYLAANYPDRIAGLINFSPNVQPKARGIGVVDKPWGIQISKLVNGGKYRQIPEGANVEYWSEGYRMEAVGALMALVNRTMLYPTFENITAPTLNLAYYKNEDEQDPVVKVERIRAMHRDLATPDSLKVYAELPDAGSHTMATEIYSKDLPGVRREVFGFADRVLKLPH